MRLVPMRDLRGHWWLVPELAVLWGMAGWSSPVSGLSRICDLPVGGPLAIRQGCLVVTGSDPGKNPTLVVRPVRGGKPRTLPMPAGHSPRGVQVTDTHLVYLTSSEGSGARVPGTPLGPDGAPRGRCSAYALHRLPWAGGDPEVQRFEGETGAHLTPSGCYWRGARKEKTRPLNFIPLLNGESREIASGDGVLPHGSSAGGGPVLLSSARREARRHSRRVYGETPELAEDENLLGMPVTTESGGRCYWVERGVEYQPDGQPRPDRIMSARRDGKDRKVVLEALNRSVEFGQLVSYGKDLYMVLVEPPSDGAGSAKSGRQLTLCRIRPEDTSAEPERVCTLPGLGGSVHIDGQDAYLAVPEAREAWWDWSSGGQPPRWVMALYRLRLPRA